MRFAWILLVFILNLHGIAFSITTSAAGRPPQTVTLHTPIPDPHAELQLLTKPEIASLLIDRTYQRPERCPLRVLKHQDLQAKLLVVANALKYGECYNRNQALVNGLDEMLKQSSVVGQAAVTRGVFNGGVGATLPPVLAKGSDHKELLSTLEKVSVDEECVSNIRKRGLLPVVADIATNIGQMALFIPSPNGFMVGVGAVGLGATLKVVWSLLKSPFDWDLASDRDQFLEINCSFFDLRRDIEAAEILEPFDARLDDKINATRDAGILLQDKIAELEQRQEALQAEIDAASAVYVSRSAGKLRFDLARAIETFLMAAHDAAASAPETRKFTTINLFMEGAPRFIKDIESLREIPSYWPYLKGLLAQVTWSNLAAVNALTEDEFFETLHKPITLYLATYVRYLQEREHELVAKFYDVTMNASPQTVSAYKSAADNAYAAALTPLQEALGRVGVRLHVLESKLGKKAFKDSDDSAHGTFSVLQEYKVVQDTLYGKLGYSFLDYFRKKVKYDKRYFLKGYERFTEQTAKPLAGQDLKWACRDANQLRLLWESANASAEVAYDLIATNRGIFHSNVKYLRTFLFFIPVGRTSQYLMYRHVRGAEDTVDRLARHLPIDWKGLKKWGFRKSHNLGRLMAEVKQSEAMRLDVEAFLDAQDCPNYL